MKADGSLETRLVRKLGIIVLAIALTVVGLFVAVLAGGPVIRALLGPPPGFREDYVSHEAFRQAVLVQAFCIGIAFFALGLTLGRGSRPSWKLALTAANPLTVGLGFVVFRSLYQSLHLGWDYEYYGLLDGAILALTAPIIFSACFRTGASIRKSRFEKLHAAQSK